jgi:hypothetical protein
LPRGWITGGNCQRVDVYDPAISNEIPVMSDEKIRAAIAADSHGQGTPK